MARESGALTHEEAESRLHYMPQGSWSILGIDQVRSTEIAWGRKCKRGNRGAERTHFRIQNHANGRFELGGFIHKDVAETVRVAHDWDPGVVLDISYEGVAPPWDHQIDVLVQRKEGGDVFPCVYGLDVCLWEGGGL